MLRICVLIVTGKNTMLKVIKMTNGDKFRNMSNPEIARFLPYYWCDICEVIFGGKNCDCPKFKYKCDDCYSGREKYLEQNCSEN